MYLFFNIILGKIKIITTINHFHIVQGSRNDMHMWPLPGSFIEISEYACREYNMQYLAIAIDVFHFHTPLQILFVTLLYALLV